jgi:hypothetical protein
MYIFLVINFFMVKIQWVKKFWFSTESFRGLATYSDDLHIITIWNLLNFRDFPFTFYSDFDMKWALKFVIDMHFIWFYLICDIISSDLNTLLYPR